MRSSGERLQNQKGMVLFSSLAILSILLVIGIGVGVMLQTDYRVLTNLRSGTEAFYMSAAGLEWSKHEIAQSAIFPPAPASQTKNFAAGRFDVSFLPPTVVGPLAAKLVVRSVGTIGSSSHVIQAQLTKRYDLADAAIAIRGNASSVNFNSNSVFISGVDHDPATRTPLSEAQARNALSTSDEALLALVLQALGDPPQPGILDSGDAPAIARSSFLPPNVITQLANDLCGSAAASVSSMPSDGSLTIENQTLGDQTTPQLRCIEGLQASGDAVTLGGTVSGAGILIVKDAELILTGSIQWEGLIIITGSDVALRTLGSGSKELLGAVVVNETGSPGVSTPIIDIQGNLRMLFSRQALARAAELVQTPILANTYTALPSVITQQYWRTVSP